MVLRVAPQQTLEAEIAHLRSNTVPMTTHKQVLEAKVSEAIADVKRQMVEEMATKVRLCCVWVVRHNGWCADRCRCTLLSYDKRRSGSPTSSKQRLQRCARYAAACACAHRILAPSRTLTHPRCCIARWHPECGDA